MMQPNLTGNVFVEPTSRTASNQVARGPASTMVGPNAPKVVTEVNSEVAEADLTKWTIVSSDVSNVANNDKLSIHRVTRSMVVEGGTLYSTTTLAVYAKHPVPDFNVSESQIFVPNSVVCDTSKCCKSDMDKDQSARVGRPKKTTPETPAATPA